MSSKKLEGKVAVITGGNSGIGLATAQLFKEEGAKIAIMGRDAKTVGSALAALSPDAIGFTGDVGSIQEIEAFMDNVKQAFGKIDTLFVNAGVGSRGPVASCTEEEFDKVFNVNAKGAFFTVQKALPLMPKGSSIVLMSSVNNQLGMLGTGAYGGSKAAVRLFARVFAAELMEQGIRVNAVSPGPIETPILSRRMDAAGVAQTQAYLRSIVPMKRLGLAEEVAKAVLFLSCDDSSFITGTEIMVDGGITQI